MELKINSIAVLEENTQSLSIREYVRSHLKRGHLGVDVFEKLEVKTDCVIQFKPQFHSNQPENDLLKTKEVSIATQFPTLSTRIPHSTLYM